VELVGNAIDLVEGSAVYGGSHSIYGLTTQSSFAPSFDGSVAGYRVTLTQHESDPRPQAVEAEVSATTSFVAAHAAAGQIFLAPACIGIVRLIGRP
jgi:hypothetical protein